MYIAIDFDGTMVERDYPRIGRANPGAFEYVKLFQKYGAKIILYTMRDGTELADAVSLCEARGITLHGVNANPSQRQPTQSPKVWANLYIDDLAVGCPTRKASNGTVMADWRVIGPHVLSLIEDWKVRGDAA